MSSQAATALITSWESQVTSLERDASEASCNGMYETASIKSTRLWQLKECLKQLKAATETTA